ncbi:MAG: type II toxin-antitoxin system PemK/MazF family toxin [Parcubacteria group bacterium]|nr:type II toxin-antitoxin system PemK/MazF family toxin [Parcubacteria group bacterium]
MKSFQEWCRIKIYLWKKDSKIVFKQSEIWWCSLGMNLGEEIFGKGVRFTRPVLVFRKFTSNSFLGLPLTTHQKKGTWYVEITMHGKTNWAMLNQARVLDKKRLTNRIGTLDNADFQKVRDAFLKFYQS